MHKQKGSAQMFFAPRSIITRKFSIRIVIFALLRKFTISNLRLDFAHRKGGSENLDSRY